MQIHRFLFSILFGLIISISTVTIINAQNSIARQWNELQLFSIKNDYTRPTVQARNLHYVSAAMYDAWAAYDSVAKPYFLGNTVNGYQIPFETLPRPVDIKSARHQAINFAAYRLLSHKYSNAPKRSVIFPEYVNKMESFGLDTSFISIDYKSGDPRALGNYIAHHIIKFGLTDGSNEQDDYNNLYYEPINPPLKLDTSGTSGIVDLNRWQPLRFNLFVDQGGNINPNNVPFFLGAEWGNLAPFSLDKNKSILLERDSNYYRIYHDPGHPPYIEALDTAIFGDFQNFYKNGHLMVAQWSTHLNNEDETLWDISPKHIGKSEIFPVEPRDYFSFYNFENGGVKGNGHIVNPKTGMPYESQFVKRSDYARVLAEFWADGPNSETPPGHWFSIFNHACDHPEMIRKFNGVGPLLDSLEWDIKAYFALGGAVHDAAIAAWSVKGYYDYVRPISAIRGLAELGQATDPELPRYHKDGLPLIPGLTELVTKNDPLVGLNLENLWEVKIKSWRGYSYLTEDNGNVAGVGWILAKNFVPYQRATFVTPPFGGYVSGHSTFSRAAAELLTLFTGDAFFPGGLAEFHAAANTYLIHESGPSQDVTLQWATYRDAADQCSLSRIWGGIHPPQDDIPGRVIGEKVGINAFATCVPLFYTDRDKDGFYSYEDCDDTDPIINPHTIWYADKDNDGFVNSNDSIIQCQNPPLYVLLSQSNGLDCDDSNPEINPAGLDIANNELDEDCSGSDLISTISDTKDKDIIIFPTIILSGNEIHVAHAHPGIITYQIKDFTGKIILSGDLSQQQSIITPNLNQGLYLITIFEKYNKIIKATKLVFI